MTVGETARNQDRRKKRMMGKFWSILSPSQRRGAFAMLGLMLVGMVLETVGVGLVIPAVAFMSQADAHERFPALAPLLDALGNPSHRELMVGGMVLLLSVFTIKTAFAAYLIWRQAAYVASIQIELAHRLFAAYLRQPYTFHLQRNSAELIRNVSNEVSMFSTSIGAVIILLSELLVVVGILALLVAIQPIGAALVLVVLVAVASGYHVFFRGRLLAWGEARQIHDGLRFQHLLQGLGAVKDVKLLGRESDFLSQFQYHSSGTSLIGRVQTTLQQLPRLFLELMAVVGLVIVVLVMLAAGESPGTILSTLGVFAAAAFRLLPSANRVLGSVQSIRYALPVFETLSQEFSDLVPAEPPQRGPRMKFERALRLEGVSFRYAGKSTPAIQNVNITVARGTTIGFIGKTGAGKSTLVDLMLGLFTPEEGSIRVDGVDIRSNVRGWQDQIGYVPQSIYLTDDTLRRNVAFGVREDEIDDDAIRRALDLAQMTGFVAELPLGTETVVGERGVRLSGGQRQRIGIARALYHDPGVLVLDEATSSLDTATERDLMQAIRALHGRKTIIIVAHRLTTVEHCDHLYRLERGKVVEDGSTTSVLGLAYSAN